MNLDVRISTLMAGWTNEVNSALLKRIRTLMPEGSKLKRQHPTLSAADLQDIPGACVKCHAESTTQTASLGPMMHVIHLGGVRDGHFLSIFQGDCTHCHKLDMSTGKWRMPSGPERPKASQQAKGQAAIVVYRPGPQGLVGKETFDLVVFPFLVILFTAVAVVLYLGVIAWVQDPWRDEMRSREA